MSIHLELNSFCLAGKCAFLQREDAEAPIFSVEVSDFVVRASIVINE